MLDEEKQMTASLDYNVLVLCLAILLMCSLAFILLSIRISGLTKVLKIFFHKEGRRIQLLDTLSAQQDTLRHEFNELRDALKDSSCPQISLKEI